MCLLHGKVVENADAQGKEGSDIKWTTLVHNGVLFPPEYQPHGVKLLYDGRPMDLSPAQVHPADPPRLLFHPFCCRVFAVESASLWAWP